jgi:hypothetical protein
VATSKKNRIRGGPKKAPPLGAFLKDKALVTVFDQGGEGGLVKACWTELRHVVAAG